MPADARRAFLLHFCHVYAPYMYLLFDHLFPSNATPNTSGSGGATISTAAAHYLHVHHISRPLTVWPQGRAACGESVIETPRHVIENTRVKTAFLVGVACGAPFEPIAPVTAGTAVCGGS